jgi:glycosyltransferase involved in cell wall biosynthesis
VHASEVELEGIAVLEAMSAGLPVLVAESPESAASELAVSDDFRFPAGDPRALAEKIDALVERPSLLRDERDRRRTGAGPITFAESVERLLRVYRSVL